MSNNTEPRSPKSEAEIILSSMVKDEVGKSLGVIQILFCVILLGIAFLIGFVVMNGQKSADPITRSASLQEDLSQQPTSLSLVAKPATAADPRAEIVGRVSALMTTVDGKVSAEELAFALKLFSKRSKADFGSAIGSALGGEKVEFVDRRAILRAYDAEEDFLRVNDGEKSLMRHQESTITDLFSIIQAYTPDSGESDPSVARTELMKQTLALAGVWVEHFASMPEDAKAPANQALYQAMQERLTDRLDMSKP
ncbi:hypothetical protein [Pseudomonas amygdali]|uniref:Uncharacterized protein n=3 Tax=Pseudomonas amygdali TaxID=47877 RepID=A0ABR5KTM8_PSEAV|nr:hypothetical protein [Pseudomonas amygdali]AXH59824.1 hypothetical protein PLA107_031870 [Pseudomonas amygdali pv. lachrymans str. M301315]KPC17242.1 Uncharacterized protein AC499_0444 [Pseudomonas amygdali pv. lachrymans]KPC18201.1 Uncharacterized protein AC499_1403 [Pseudomonas amygdali pv. lachrymans]RMT06271.1 hypothetical protein ALP54_03709 [Pseudomonas amygdali pv. lachrymans]